MRTICQSGAHAAPHFEVADSPEVSAGIKRNAAPCRHSRCAHQQQRCATVPDSFIGNWTYLIQGDRHVVAFPSPRSLASACQAEALSPAAWFCQRSHPRSIAAFRIYEDVRAATFASSACGYFPRNGRHRGRQVEKFDPKKIKAHGRQSSEQLESRTHGKPLDRERKRLDPISGCSSRRRSTCCRQHG